MFQWWAGLSPVVRLGIAGAFLLASTVIWLAGYFWPWGCAAGIVLLLFSFPNDAQKKGYHDF